MRAKVMKDPSGLCSAGMADTHLPQLPHSLRQAAGVIRHRAHTGGVCAAGVGTGASRVGRGTRRCGCLPAVGARHVHVRVAVVGERALPEWRRCVCATRVRAQVKC